MLYDSVLSVTSSSLKSSTYLRQLIMNGVRPGPRNASDVMRGNTSPVEMARSDTVPSFSPVESYTGRPSMLVR